MMLSFQFLNVNFKNRNFRTQLPGRTVGLIKNRYDINWCRLKIKFSRPNTRAKETRVKMIDGFATDNRGYRLIELFMAQNLDIWKDDRSKRALSHGSMLK